MAIFVRHQFRLWEVFLLVTICAICSALIAHWGCLVGSMVVIACGSTIVVGRGCYDRDWTKIVTGLSVLSGPLLLAAVKLLR